MMRKVALPTLDQLAALHMQPVQQGLLGGGAANAVILAMDRVGDADRGNESRRAEQGPVVVHRFEFDQVALGLFAVAQRIGHGAHRGGGRDLAIAGEEGVLLCRGRAMHQIDRDVAAQKDSARNRAGR